MLPNYRKYVGECPHKSLVLRVVLQYQGVDTKEDSGANASTYVEPYNLGGVHLGTQTRTVTWKEKGNVDTLAHCVHASVDQQPKEHKSCCTSFRLTTFFFNESCMPSVG